jgi:hypothetical protein
LTIGLVIASGYVMARAGYRLAKRDGYWRSVGLMLATRLNPVWILMTGGALGGLGLL